MSNTISVDPVNGKDYFGINKVQSKSELDMDMFLKLLVTQLEHQNPLEPMNDRDFFAQMAQLGTVQGLDKVKDSMDSTQATSLMGQVVTAVRPMSDTGSGQNELVVGTVRRMTMKNGERYLGLEEANGGIVEVKMAAIRNIQPSIDIAAAANLIGKTVTGAYNSGTAEIPSYGIVSGVVTGAFVKDSRAMLAVKDASGKTHDVAMDTVSDIRS